MSRCDEEQNIFTTKSAFHLVMGSKMKLQPFVLLSNTTASTILKNQFSPHIINSKTINTFTHERVSNTMSIKSYKIPTTSFNITRMTAMKMLTLQKS